MRRALIAVLFALLPLQVLAHAQLRASDPAEGAVLARSPVAITLTFNQSITPLVLRLIGPDGATTDLEGRAENATLTIAPPVELADGTHLLSWRVVSDDGHPVGGTLTFHVGSPSATPPTPVELAAGAARMGAVLRAVLTTALVVAVGAAVFAAIVAPLQASPTLARITVFAAGASLPVGGLLIGLIETMWSHYFSTDYKDVAAFSILAIVLIFLPSGLLGKPEGEKV